MFDRSPQVHSADHDPRPQDLGKSDHPSSCSLKVHAFFFALAQAGPSTFDPPSNGGLGLLWARYVREAQAQSVTLNCDTMCESTPSHYPHPPPACLERHRHLIVASQEQIISMAELKGTFV
jgi:hypothetical protein